MIYTLGYQGLDVPTIAAVLEALDARLVDVRSIPQSRKKGFGKKALTEAFGSLYEWRGDQLGGKPPGVSRVGLYALASDYGDDGGPSAVLMCMEHAPGDCHRHWAIAEPLAHMGVTVMHLFEGEIFTAAALHRALEDDSEYDCDGSPVAHLLSA